MVGGVGIGFVRTQQTAERMVFCAAATLSVDWDARAMDGYEARAILARIVPSTRIPAPPTTFAFCGSRVAALTDDVAAFDAWVIWVRGTRETLRTGEIVYTIPAKALTEPARPGASRKRTGTAAPAGSERHTRSMDDCRVRSLLSQVQPCSHITPPSTFAYSREHLGKLTDDLAGVDEWVASVGGSQRELGSGAVFYMVPAKALERRS